MSFVPVVKVDANGLPEIPESYWEWRARNAYASKLIPTPDVWLLAPNLLSFAKGLGGSLPSFSSFVKRIGLNEIVSNEAVLREARTLLSEGARDTLTQYELRSGVSGNAIVTTSYGVGRDDAAAIAYLRAIQYMESGGGKTSNVDYGAILQAAGYRFPYDYQISDLAKVSALVTTTGIDAVTALRLLKGQAAPYVAPVNTQPQGNTGYMYGQPKDFCWLSKSGKTIYTLTPTNWKESGVTKTGKKKYWMKVASQKV